MVTVGPDSPVTINYSLSLEGVSSSRESLQFRYGGREMFPKLKQALAGISGGEEKGYYPSSSRCYGGIDTHLIQVLLLIRIPW